MSFVSWNKVYFLFPRSTYLEHKTYAPYSGREDYTDLFTWARSRGYRTFGAIPPRAQIENIGRSRRVGDAHTWILPLDTSDIPSTGATPDAALESTAFTIATDEDPTQFSPEERYNDLGRILELIQP